MIYSKVKQIPCVAELRFRKIMSIELFEIKL